MMQKKRSEKSGLSPGSIVHIGEQKVDRVKISLIDYDPKKLDVKTIDLPEETYPLRETDTVSWINVIGLHDAEILNNIGSNFGIHALTLEDIVNTETRPKVEFFDDYIFIVLKMIFFSQEQQTIEIEQVSIILGKNYVITFQEREGDIFNPIRNRIQVVKGRLRQRGADYLTYTLIDVVVDNYYIILENISETLELLEEEVSENPDKTIPLKIQSLKKDTLLLRKTLWPLREAINHLNKQETGLFADSTSPYLQDLYDHAIQVVDTLETFREAATGLLELYQSTVSNKMNEVMKVLTIVASIFIPLTFIAGIYGMNFENMPELKWSFGYFMAWTLMVLIGLTLVIYFKKRKWL
jgi:magnesium transporter